MKESIIEYCKARLAEFVDIPADRKRKLEEIAGYALQRIQDKKPLNLNFICTHNSRRSMCAQIWAQTAAKFYDLQNVHSYSGGTEVSEAHPNMVAAFKRIGFGINSNGSSVNPHYSVEFDVSGKGMEVFSKLYDDKFNPENEFMAVMVCSSAEKNCPFVPGAEKRISLTFDDPKDFDSTPLQDKKYDERCAEIARDILYIFAAIKTKLHAA